MKKVRNKQWRDRHAQIKFRHELKRRYKYDERYTVISGLPYEPYGSVEYYQSKKAEKRVRRKLSQNRFETLTTPKEFSIFINPEESLSFFSNIETRIEFGNPIYFDMKNIEVLSIDTIMYFLAILKRIKSSKVTYGIKGSVPSNKKCRDLLESSGFSRYVHSGKTKKDLDYATEVIQITSGHNADNSTAKRICDFVMSKVNLTRIDIKKLYIMLIELMTNTKHHAYSTGGRRQFTLTDWYIFARYISDKNSVSFIFLDTGKGIPFTVKRKGFEPTREFIGFGPNHAEYINSALKGEFRSRTGESYRGKGLPKIYSYNIQRYINSLTIISNYGYFADNKMEDIRKELKGTLFYWELSKES